MAEKQNPTLSFSGKWYSLGPVICSVCVPRSKPLNRYSAKVRILEVTLPASPSLPAFVAGLSFHYLHSVLAVWDH